MRYENHPCDFCGTPSPNDIAHGWWTYDRYVGPSHNAALGEISGRACPSCAAKIHTPEGFKEVATIQRVTKVLTK